MSYSRGDALLYDEIMIRRLLLLLIGFVPMATHAGDVYQWVDERGRRHFGDTITPEDRKSAKTMNLKAAEPTSEQRREAEARAANDKKKSEDDSKKRRAGQPSTSETAAPSPERVSTTESDCERAKREYMESAACFAPYGTRNGGVRAEAFERCTVVKQPRC